MTNRGSAATGFSVFVEQRRWIVITNPQQTAVLAPGQTAFISFRVRRLYKNPSILNGQLISIRSNADNLTRSYASVQLQ